MKKNEYIMEDIDIMSSTENLLKRPCMYTPNGTSEEIYAYLLGSDDVIKNSQLTVRSPTPQNVLDWFYNEFNNLGGSLDFTRLREKFGSDKAIFKTIFEDIQKFRPHES